MSNTVQENRELRKKETGEEFTPTTLVNEMLDKLPSEVWEPGKTFCDPACGNGNMLIEVLKRKLSFNHSPLIALKSIFGVDIFRDNIKECRLRLLQIILQHEPITEEHVKAVMKNIVFLAKTKYPTGSLEYNFKFDGSPKKEDVQKFMKEMTEKGLDAVDLPVYEEAASTVDGQMVFDLSE